MLNNEVTQPSKYSRKNLVEINDGTRGIYNTNSHIKFKTAMLKPSLYDHSDAYTLLKGMITIAGEGDTAGVKQTDKRARGVISTNCGSFTDCMCEIINKQIYNAKYLHILMPMYNLIECSDNYCYLKTTESYLQFCRDEPNL